MPRTLDQTELLETFARTVHELYVRHTRVGYVLVLLLIPAGSMLDYFAYANDPEIFWRFFRARAICTLALLPLGVWAFRPSAWKWMRSLSTVLVLAPIVAMCWMVYITDRRGFDVLCGVEPGDPGHLRAASLHRDSGNCLLCHRDWSVHDGLPVQNRHWVVGR